MPVLGPDYNKEYADEAYEEIFKLLNKKYNLFNFPADTIFLEDKEEAKKQLKDAIHNIFKHDCWESW